MKISKTYLQNKALPVALLAFLGLLPLLIVGFNRYEYIVLENRTAVTLKVNFAFGGVERVQANYTRFDKGTVNSGESINAEVNRIRSASYLIEAKDPNGNIVFTGEYSPEQLDEMDWTVVFTE